MNSKDKSTQGSPNATFNAEIVAILEECVTTLDSKGKDYGRDNFVVGAQIASLMRGKEITPMDVIAGIFGVKITRRNYLIKMGLPPENESLQDSIKDAINYLLLEERERRRYVIDHPEG